ncbi:NADP-dependent oxidoreductase [Angustibacter sp. Root456]|uniref:NADP-dependent oxidoreductase n=1 Tax=Angustibacter sp. Root456 TaxID=1736539 RepID=UPI0006FDDBDE|nr:NADP-dependent oxidoreductase [Angustibacter sp. Root456]KQX65673.1 alcohol dehydrogenase [Angustibacter sp. Root456]
MKAITISSYGGADVMELTDQPDPIVGPDYVLVRVKASSVNPVDYKIREGYLQGAFPSHLPMILGWDVAGVVEKVGPAVREFAEGDEVIGYVRKDSIEHGTYAELVSAHVRHLARKPASATFEEAGALPLAGLTALQSLRLAEVGEGDTVLVHAAAGGVGSFAVQIAKSLGARVIGTASAANHEYLRSLGAEPVEYGDKLVAAVQELAPDGVDAVVDYVGGDALANSPELAKSNDRIVSIVDAATVLGFGGRYAFVRPDPDDLAEVARLVDAGQLRVELARTFPLAEAADAQRLVEGGHVRGKVAISVP